MYLTFEKYFESLCIILKNVSLREIVATVDFLWGQPLKLIQVVSTSEFHEYCKVIDTKYSKH